MKDWKQIYKWKFGLCSEKSDKCDCYRELKFIETLLFKQKKEFLEKERDYWKDVFDKRPTNRDLESDIIAQNFARIEIERLESKIENLNEIKLYD